MGITSLNAPRDRPTEARASRRGHLRMNEDQGENDGVYWVILVINQYK